MKYLKLKIKKTKDKKDDATIHYSYGFDTDLVKRSKMDKSEKFLICEVDDDINVPDKIEKISKKKYDELFDNLKQ